MHGIGRAVFASILIALGAIGTSSGVPRGYVYDTIEWRTADSAVVATGRIWAVVHNDAQDSGFATWDTVSFAVQDTIKGSVPRVIQFRVRSSKTFDQWKNRGTLLLVFLAESRRFHSRAASLFRYAPHTGFVGGSFIDLSADSGAAVFTEHDGFVTGPAAILRHAAEAVEATKAAKYCDVTTQVALIDGLGGPGGYTVEAQLASANPPIGPTVRFEPTAEYDGRSIVAVQGKILKLWNAVTGRLLRTYGPSIDPLLSEAISPDEEHIVGGSGGQPKPGSSKDNRIRVWDRLTGVLADSTDTKGPVSDIQFLEQSIPGGGYFVTTTREDYGDEPLRQRLWDIWDLDDKMIFPGVDPQISPDASMVLTIDREGWVGVWDAKTHMQLSTIPGDLPFHKEFRSAEFSSYGNRVVTTSTSYGGLKLGYESDIDVWEAETGKHVFTVVGRRLTDATYTRDGKHIVTASRDGIGVYDAESGEQERSIKLSGNVYKILLNADGSRCLAKWGPGSSRADADNAGLFDLSTGKELMHLSGDVSGLVGFSRDGKSLFCFGPGMKTGTIWSAESGAVSRKLELR